MSILISYILVIVLSLVIIKKVNGRLEYEDGLLVLVMLFLSSMVILSIFLGLKPNYVEKHDIIQLEKFEDSCFIKVKGSEFFYKIDGEVLSTEYINFKIDNSADTAYILHMYEETIDYQEYVFFGALEDEFVFHVPGIFGTIE